MTIAERNNKLKHFITCLKCEVSGKCCDDNCPTQYDAGNMGEIIENLEAISKALEEQSNTWNLDDVREDFMYDVYNILDFLSTNEEANLIIDSFDRVTSGIKQQPCADAISRQEVLDQTYFWSKDEFLRVTNPFDYLRKRINSLSPVTTQPKMGKWMDDKCSVCGKGTENLISSPEWYRNETPSYCPFCGVRLEVK